MASSLMKHDSRTNPLTLWAGMHDLTSKFADKKNKKRADSVASEEPATNSELSSSEADEG